MNLDGLLKGNVCFISVFPVVLITNASVNSFLQAYWHVFHLQAMQSDTGKVIFSNPLIYQILFLFWCSVPEWVMCPG